MDKPDVVVFHYNKAHNWDPENVPPWAVKTRGQTHYVWHMSSMVPFSTRETPDSPHTKGSLRLKGLLTIVTYEDGSNEAVVE